MDTGIDFIQPEFLNILFFEQKNLIIYPYVDLKHLHALESFTVGHNIVDLDSTALHNIREIIEADSYDSYSQTPSFYFVFNLNKEKIKEVIKIDQVRCILNTNDKMDNFRDGALFISYNKKTNSFSNYHPENNDLDFEKYLISSSENEAILLDKIHKIKSVATRIFTEANQNGNLNNLPEMLEDYNEKYWGKILRFVEKYYKIDLPKIPKNLSGKRKNNSRLEDYSQEYDYIISLNKNIAKEFIHLLHDWRSNHVNPSNLEIEQLHSPIKLYEYLRNHHWREEMPSDFLIDWMAMKNTRYNLNEDDHNDFEKLFNFLKVPDDFIINSLDTYFTRSIKDNQNKEHINNKSFVNTSDLEYIPNLDNFSEFKKWLLKRLDQIEDIM
jgi:hypothetical protein